MQFAVLPCDEKKNKIDYYLIDCFFTDFIC